MAFRDDKDALEGRLRDLEQDLLETRRGLEEKDAELKRLRERLGGIDKPASRSRRVVLLAMGLALVVVAGTAFVTIVAVREPPPPVLVAAPPVAVPAPLVPASLPVPVTPPRPAESAPPAIVAELLWSARVVGASGPFADVKPGSRCAVEVRAVAPAGGRSSIGFHRVAIRCGDRVVYDTTAPTTGTMMSQTGGDLSERRVGGTLVYQLLYQDQGTRSLGARPQVEIGTARGVARAFHDGALGGALTLAVDRDSAPRTGEALSTGARSTGTAAPGAAPSATSAPTP